MTDEFERILTERLRNHKHSSGFWAQYFGNNGSACKPYSTNRFRNIESRLNVSFGTRSKSLLSLGSDQSLYTQTDMKNCQMILNEKNQILSLPFRKSGCSRPDAGIDVTLIDLFGP